MGCPPQRAGPRAVHFYRNILNHLFFGEEKQRVDETLSHYRYPQAHWTRIKANNPLERIMGESRRRSYLVSAFQMAVPH